MVSRTFYQQSVSRGILNQAVENFHDISNIESLPNNSVFLTTYRKNNSINLNVYMSFLKKHWDSLINDGNGDKLYTNVIMEDAHQTYEIQLFLESNGFKPIPVFRIGQDERYLDYYVNNYSFVVIIYEKQPLAVLDELWSKVLLSCVNTPRARLHISNPSLQVATRYPWYSLDTDNWKIALKGDIYWPNMQTLSLAEDSKNRSILGKHINNLNELELSEIESWFDSFSYLKEDLINDVSKRAHFNIRMFEEYLNEYSVNEHNYSIPTQGLF